MDGKPIYLFQDGAFPFKLAKLSSLPIFICSIAALPLISSALPLDRPAKDSRTPERIDFYLKRLGDRKYVDYRTHDDTDRPWYLAAEELGRIGSPAVLPLIEKLRTTKVAYERTVTFYALRLAAQAAEINTALGRTIPDYPLAWPPEKDHERLKRLWLNWWAKHGSAIQKLATDRLSRER